MKLYAAIGEDGPDSARLRQQHLAAHLDYVAAHLGDYAVAGPLKRAGAPAGSLLVIKAENEAAARARLEADPYARAGVWPRLSLYEFAAVAGDWVGGAAWLRGA